MTHTLIVLAHPEALSFNAAWAAATKAACHRLGHDVLWSDLAAMGFDPVESPRHYPDLSQDETFDPLKTQAAAAASGRLPPDVATEIDKIRRADRIVFHFPLWWFAPPALIKGWCERVLAHGALHDVDARFDTGRCRGKTALMCVTTGSSAAQSAHDGKEGDVQMLLWPMAYTLRYLGFTVLSPILVHGVHGYHTGAAKAALDRRLTDVLAQQHGVIASFDQRHALRFHADTDFDAEGRLKPGRDSLSAFIRHAP